MEAQSVAAIRAVSVLQGQRSINAKDSACFWWSLYIQVCQELISGLTGHWLSQGLLMCTHRPCTEISDALGFPGLGAPLSLCWRIVCVDIF